MVIQQTPLNKAVYAINAIYIRILKIIVCTLTFNCILHIVFYALELIFYSYGLLRQFVCLCPCTCSDFHSGNSFSNQGLNIKPAESEADFRGYRKLKPNYQKKVCVCVCLCVCQCLPVDVTLP